MKNLLIIGKNEEENEFRIHKCRMESIIQLAQKSPDERTQVGCMLVDLNKSTHKILSKSFNDLVVSCPGIDKNCLFEHAERKILFEIGGRLKNNHQYVMYITLFPCIDCARAIIKNNISTIIIYNLTHDYNMKVSNQYVKTYNISKRMLECGNVNIVMLDFNSKYKIRVDGELV